MMFSCWMQWCIYLRCSHFPFKIERSTEKCEKQRKMKTIVAFVWLKCAAISAFMRWIFHLCFQMVDAARCLIRWTYEAKYRWTEIFLNTSFKTWRDILKVLNNKCYQKVFICFSQVKSLVWLRMAGLVQTRWDVTVRYLWTSRGRAEWCGCSRWSCVLSLSGSWRV